MADELLAHGLEYGWNYLLDAVSKTEKAALYVFVVVLQNLIKLIKELNLPLNYNHPSEVELEQQEESQDTLASNHDMLVLKKLH